MARQHEFSREHEMTAPTAAFLQAESFDVQQEEAPFYEYRIDLYGYSRRRELTIAVELKLHRWRRAVEQGLLYQLCADLVYIAVPIDMTRNVSRAVLEEHGLGLLAVGRNGVHRIVTGRPSAFVKRHYRDHFIRLLKENTQASADRPGDDANPHGHEKH